jgi:hypothetical protein
MAERKQWSDGVRIVRGRSLAEAMRHPSTGGRATAFDFANTGGRGTWIGSAILVALTLLLSGCASPPPIARGLPSAFAEARPVFDQRVRDRFPVGSAEADLQQELHRQGFTVSKTGGERAPHYLVAYEFAASRSEGTLACKLTWTIYWSAEAGKIANVAGDYGATCL